MPIIVDPPSVNLGLTLNDIVIPRFMVQYISNNIPMSANQWYTLFNIFGRGEVRSFEVKISNDLNVDITGYLRITIDGIVYNYSKTAWDPEWVFQNGSCRMVYKNELKIEVSCTAQGSGYYATYDLSIGKEQ